QWTIIPDMPSMPYDDVCVFNGRPIAVDNNGQTVAVRPDLCLDLVAEAVFGGDKKFLVESDGELLLVDKYLSNCILNADGVNEIGMERVVRFDVFRLDEKEKKWVEVRNLGDRVLFLGEDCVFSAASCNGNGNCVIFMDDVYRNCHSTELGISVFHLDQRRISPLSDFTCYSKLFWPPPEWVGLHVDNNRVLILD
ncbi:F-box family protein, partial [Trifolium medium]|nr:F-box family protein [Trifolium medium]